MNDVFKVFSPVEKFDIHAAVLDRHTRYNTYPGGVPEPSKIRRGIETEGKYPWRYTEHPCTLDTCRGGYHPVVAVLRGAGGYQGRRCRSGEMRRVPSTGHRLAVPGVPDTQGVGGFRTIEAPSKLLKRVQRVILEKVLYQSFRISNQAMGFVPRRSIKGTHCVIVTSGRNWTTLVGGCGRWTSRTSSHPSPPIRP